ncbi:MAG TPA: NAD(P)-dependent alcohol dehydrogenase [Actinomycetes bacterium]
MKAIVYHEYGCPDVLRLADIEPPVIGDRDVLVRVRASSVNMADLAVVTGRPGLIRAVTGLRRPRKQVPGRDLAGVVEAVGAEVAGLRPGDEVYGEATQAYAEYAAVNPAQLSRKPGNLSFEQAATVPLAGLTAWQALEKAQIQPGQRVLVSGASGGVGHFAVQIAKAQGAQVTGVCSRRNAELVTSLGADRVIDYQHSDYTTLGALYDVIVDVVVTHRLADTRRALTPSGVYLSVGTSPDKGPGEGGLMGPFPTIAAVVIRSMTARPQRLVTVSAKPNRGIAELTSLIESGTVAPSVERTYPLAEVPDALRHLATHHARGKLAITI